MTTTKTYLIDRDVEDLLMKHAGLTEYNDPDNGSWWYWDDCHEHADGTNVAGLGTVTVVETFGGEGQGDRVHIVFRVSGDEGVQHYKIDGYYSSYSGTEWDGQLYEVTPQQRTITIYE